MNVPVLSLLQFNFGGFEGRNPAPVDVVDIPAFLDVLYIPGGDGRNFRTINSKAIHSQVSKIPSLHQPL